MRGRSGCRVLDGCESGRDGRACDGLPTEVGCVGVFLLSGRGGTEDGCIGGPGLELGLPAPFSCCEGVDGLASESLEDGSGSLSLDGAGVPGFETPRFDPLSSARAGARWAPLLESTDQFLG